MALSCINSSAVSAFLPLRLYLCASSMEGVAALTSSEAWEGGALLATIGWKGSSTSVSASLMALDLMAGWFLTDSMVVQSGNDLLLECLRSSCLSVYLMLSAAVLRMSLL